MKWKAFVRMSKSFSQDARCPGRNLDREYANIRQECYRLTGLFCELRDKSWTVAVMVSDADCLSSPCPTNIFTAQ
jgi:hypothetical protein